VKVDVRVTESADHSTASALLSRAKEFRADLVVMGAYGHSRLTEFVFGGVTRTALWDAELPVLMSR
jgi:nucleotide-binding universal stress UspA family protein